MKIITFLILFSVCIYTTANGNLHNTECDGNSSRNKVINGVFDEKKMSLTYKYCEYLLDGSIFFKGYQSIKVELDNQVYIYSNDDVNSDGYFGGEMFYSKLGVFGIVERTTGNYPFTVTYLSIIDDDLVLLGKITFEQKMGNIIGRPYIESRDDRASEFIKKTLTSNKEYILGDYYQLNYYEGLLFILADDFSQLITVKEFNQLSYKLLDYPDLVNFYRQNVFFKESSLCIYDENVIEMEAFGCEIKNKKLSICYNYFNESGLIYRYGNKGKIELELSRKIKEDDNALLDLFIFEKNMWKYEVHANPQNSGVLIKKNGKDISFLKCDNNNIEPVILDPVWK